MKDKVVEAAGDAKENAAPVVDKLKDGVSGAVDAVKEGAERVSGLFKPDIPRPEGEERAL